MFVVDVLFVVSMAAWEGLKKGGKVVKVVGGEEPSVSLPGGVCHAVCGVCHAVLCHAVNTALSLCYTHIHICAYTPALPHVNSLRTHIYTHYCC